MPDDKTGPKAGAGLAKAVNAAVSVRSNKDSLKTIEDRYFRPENCNYLCSPRVNSEVWRVMPRNAHTNDVSLQEIQKVLATGMVPIIQTAELCSQSKSPVDPIKVRNLMSDAISLVGHGLFSISQRRRYNMRTYINDKYKSICNQETPITNLLFGEDCMKRLKDMGDVNRTPLVHPRFARKDFRRQSNFRGPVQGQGNRYSQRGNQRGRHPNYRYPRNQNQYQKRAQNQQQQQ